LGIFYSITCLQDTYTQQVVLDPLLQLHSLYAYFPGASLSTDISRFHDVFNVVSWRISTSKHAYRIHAHQNPPNTIHSNHVAPRNISTSKHICRIHTPQTPSHTSHLINNSKASPPDPSSPSPPPKPSSSTSPKHQARPGHPSHHAPPSSTTPYPFLHAVTQERPQPHPSSQTNSSSDSYFRFYSDHPH